MLTRTQLFCLFTLVLAAFSPAGSVSAKSITLYTPYTEISVPPGESINYTIDVINNSSVVRTMEIALISFPDDWTYDLKAGGWKIGKLSVLPGEKKSVSLNVEVPLKVDKGSYRFNVLARGFDALPLTVIVSEKGTFKTEFSTEQPNMEGHAGSAFTFNADLKNSTAEDQLYALKANAPRGWKANFKANYKQVTSVTVEPNGSKDITIEIEPPARIEAGTYKIPVRAYTNNTSADLDLEVVITGTYDISLSTPTGLLSADITAGSEKRLELLVKNTGSAELQDIELDFSAPANWDVIFEPKEVAQLAAGDSKKVYATIKADKKAIPGDYIANLEAKTPEAASKASFRMSVETPMIWGWTGALITFVSLGSVYYLFRKYGRR